MVEAKLLRKKLKNGLIVDKWDLVTIIEKQQAEIEALKKDNKELHAIAQRMAMAESDARKSLQWFKDVQAMSSGENTILTDEEIDKVLFEISGIEPAPNSVLEFARAILRKASEK
jgi:hypothetical protein